MLPLTFVNAADYDKIAPTDRISILGLTDFQPGKNLTLRVRASVSVQGCLRVMFGVPQKAH